MFSCNGIVSNSLEERDGIILHVPRTMARRVVGACLLQRGAYVYHFRKRRNQKYVFQMKDIARERERGHTRTKRGHMRACRRCSWRCWCSMHTHTFVFLLPSPSTSSAATSYQFVSILASLLRRCVCSIDTIELESSIKVFHFVYSIEQVQIFELIFFLVWLDLMRLNSWRVYIFPND